MITRKDAPVQHVAFKTTRYEFERAQARLQDCGIHFVGTYHLGGRFYSIYFSDTNGIRLEITTDINRPGYDPVSSVYQTEEEVRKELEELYESYETRHGRV